MSKIARFKENFGEMLRVYCAALNPRELNKHENKLLKAFVPKNERTLYTYINVRCMMPFVQPDDARKTVRLDDGKSYPIYAVIRSNGVEIIGEADYIEWTDDVQSVAMLSEATYIESMEISDIDFSQCTYLSGMFNRDGKVERITFKNLIGLESNIRWTSSMFSECAKLIELDMECFESLHPFITMGMFYGCHNLRVIENMFSIDERCIDTSSMFCRCYRLEQLDLNSWDVSHVSEMDQMFYKCKGLKTLHISKWNTIGLETAQYMFSECQSMEEAEVADWNVSNLEDTYGMFALCKSLTSLDLSKWDTRKVGTMGYMFYQCNNLAYLNLHGWRTANVDNMECMFKGCSSLKELDLSTFRTSSVITMKEMFYGCRSLKVLDVHQFAFGHCGDMRCMFAHCRDLMVLDTSGWKLSKKFRAKDNIIAGCESLVLADIALLKS